MMQICEVSKLYVLHLKQQFYGELSVRFVYFFFLIYLCTSDRFFDMVKNKVSFACYTHGAVILLAEILGDLCYYETKLLYCILNRTERIIRMFSFERGAQKCSSH